MTLLDFPGHIAATIFTPGCDMRCPFCHNKELVEDSSEYEYYPNEVLDFLKTRVGKLYGIAITGGEPLMQADIKDFIKEVRALGMKVKLDTENYRARRKETLENLAKNVAFKVKKTRRSLSLEPMNPYERRIIHAALQNDKYVTTHSEGEEPNRKVVISLKDDVRSGYSRNKY